ncbi:hypothetical protein [Romboutsia ilealis]|uniref:hypothetical protein n=1 Tax=Romboutsia ilealis TaxID=1115758 RepID=UPI0025727962|nr:hypothetical protein [Romboutsia ilealis]
MKFKDLSKDHQQFLIDCINMNIDQHADNEGIGNIEYPSLNEYEIFFDNYDEDYIIGEYGYPTSIHEDYHNKYSIEFDESNKVILNVFEYDYNDEY